MPVEVAPGRPDEYRMESVAEDQKHPLLEAHRIGRRIPGTDKWLLRDVNLRLQATGHVPAPTANAL